MTSDAVTFDAEIPGSEQFDQERFDADTYGFVILDSGLPDSKMPV